MSKDDKFEFWFNNNLRVRAYPSSHDLENKYIIGGTQMIINISDSMKPEVYLKIREMGIEYFWFPMNESSSDIGIHSIYGACVILRNAEMENKHVLMHCWGGNNRSQLVAQAYYFLRTEKHNLAEYKGFTNQLVYNCEKGHLPSIKKMELFLKELSNKLNQDLGGGDLDLMLMKITSPEKGIV